MAAIFVLLASPGVGLSRTWHVTPEGLGDAFTIQAAIDSSAAGDSILVSQGTYQELLTLSPSRILIGSWDPSFSASSVEKFPTTIDADSAGPCLTAVFDGNDDPVAEVAGLRLVNGIGALRNGFTRGGGVHAVGLARIRDCIAEQNAADFGAGLYVEGDTPSLCHVIAQSNICEYGGGGIQIIAHVRGVLDSCVVNGNSCNYMSPGPSLKGIGVLATGESCVFRSTTVSNNESAPAFAATNDGLGIYADCDTTFLSECLVFDNGSRSVIGVIQDVVQLDSLQSRRSAMLGPRSIDSRGGGVFIDGTGFIENCVVDANGTYGPDGGAFGGGVWVRRGFIDNSIISRNSANANEGAGFGGGVYADSLWIRNSTIRRNHGGGSFKGGGGGVRAEYLSMDNCAVSGNWATCSFSIACSRGGGVAGHRLEIKNSTIVGNAVGLYVIGLGCGVAVDSVGTAVIENCIVSENAAPLDDFEQAIDVGGILGASVSRFNLFYGNDGLPYSGVYDSLGHVHADPLIAEVDTLSFNLLLHSPAIDRGDPSVLDPDGSRCDIGAYGGPGASLSQPARVQGAQGLASGLGIDLDWNPAPEPDLFGYAIYRSTVPGTHPGLSTFIGAVPSATPSFIDRFSFPGSTHYYRMSAFDFTNYGGGFSEEIAATAVAWNGEGGLGESRNLLGVGMGHQFGASVIAADLNGDGVDDLAASAPGFGAGRVFVFWGKSAFGPVSELDADVIIIAPRGGEDFGWVLSAGNVNGDETEDLLIGASRASPFGRGNAGAVYLVEGRTSWPASPVTIDLASQPADRTILGASAEDRAGSSIASGDLDGDGIVDLAIGAPEHITLSGNRDGEVRILYSLASSPDSIDLASTPGTFAIIYSDSVGLFSGDRFGSALAIADVSGDAIDDLIVGSRGEDPAGRSAAGAVHVIFGRPDLALAPIIDLATTPASIRIEGAGADDQLGTAVSALDLDADGKIEIVAGAPGARAPNDTVSTGAVYLLRTGDAMGPLIALDTANAWLSLYGDDSGSLLGSALPEWSTPENAPPNLWVGARSASGGRGRACSIWGGRPVYPGIVSLAHSSTDWSIEGPVNSGGPSAPLLGGSLAVGDFDGDGTLDFATGAFGADLGPFLDAGIVSLLFNQDATAVVEPTNSSVAVDRLRLTWRGANPARGAVRLSLGVPRDEKVEIVVYDVAGRRVWGESRKFTSGVTEVLWPATTTGGAHVAAGVYIAQAISESEKAALRLLIVR